jgi:hypothetical protein
MTLVKCSGLGSGSPQYTKDIPTVQLYPNMSTEGVQITIQLSAYARLIDWASMGRTLDGIQRVLEDIQSKAQIFDASGEIDEELRSIIDNAAEAEQELSDVRAALDECHQACRRHWHAH